ncbi:Uma2 family endonuclease [Streptomyces sp. NPDC001407]|uniref:Uma2 family endonuclease n=1 Tax=Streptomyces sp. NPDC001407 TaxID=3364573 RepID=UPI00368E9FCE
MTADPVTEPVKKPQDPIDLLIAVEKAFDVPVRPECIEGMVVVPPQPDDNHNDSAAELYFQLRSAGIRQAGYGNGFRLGLKGERTRSLLIPDFYVKRRKPTEVDEAYRRAHRGWYPIDLLALVGEVTSTNHESDTGPKYRSYAAGGVPVYVVVHRQTNRVYVHSEPVPDVDNPALSHYRTTTTTEIGGKVHLPDPYPALDTAFLLES